MSDFVTASPPSNDPPLQDADARRRRAAQLRWKIIFIALIVAIPVMIGAWIASSNHQPSTAVPAASCRAVAAALADGPDSSADPVGYAEAQVLPLRQITTSDPSLHSALRQLSVAYDDFYRSDGDNASARLVSAASKKVDQYCPGVAS
jgi:hypothetical protein